ncbi:hypothetical protein [Blastomonas sp. AAP53]|uniref:hypothetical protein n=1 Tax=Blastomonas sp. AAP53 TaxID=1248760 RepID=UPI0002FFA7C2|nr:hypothetical protein [Blastomonas sp. AAP53]
MARQFRLDWMVLAGHGGPRHSQLNFEKARPDVVAAPAELPGLVLLRGWPKVRSLPAR